MRVEPFLKGVFLRGSEQTNKFSIICDDGFVCRSEDTGFASVREGDLVKFRGYPEFKSFEEFYKCDHAQLKKVLQTNPNPSELPSPRSESTQIQ